MAATKEAQRRAAAEEVCWTLILLMGVGELEISDQARDMLADPMQKWADLAVATGQMKSDKEDDA